MSLKIKDLPETERPYEKLELHGAKSLTNAELIAIIIKSGTKEETSVQLAQRLLQMETSGIGEDLSFLKTASLEELMKIKGIGKVKAVQLKAIGELAVRASKPNLTKDIPIKNIDQVAQMVMGEFKYEKHEIARVFLLNAKNCIIKVEDVALGGASFVNLDIKNILSCVMKAEASKVILVHNHPSGDATPSNADVKFTDKLYNALAIFDIDLTDHIIIGNMEYKSVYSYIVKLTEKIKNKKHK